MEPKPNRPAPVSEPLLALSPEIRDRLRARWLDPGEALRLRGQGPLRPTLYVGDSLLLRDPALDGSTVQALAEVAASRGLRLVQDERWKSDAEMLRSADLPEEIAGALRGAWVSAVRFEPDTDEPTPPPDAWTVLQHLRARRDLAPEVAAGVALEHIVISAAPGIGGNPFTNSHGVGGNPFTNSHGTGLLAGYGMPGLGGRQPVNWVGREPTPRFPLDGSDVHRPLVAVLDTGVVDHPWLGPEHVERDPSVLGQPLGLPADPSDVTGTTDPLVGDLEADSGHGTFIAGVIRQVCPDARILAVRVFGGDGVVAEGTLLRSLQLLALRQALAVSGRSDVQPVDVVSLSLGYYHEQPEDAAFDSLLLGPLTLLGRLGAAVVVSAGNDATTRPMYPAYFTPHPGGPVPATTDCLPVVAVGAGNPNTSVALFSNAGPWVRVQRPGAALVSSYPRTFRASAQPAAELVTAEGAWRATVDPDDFSAGFAVWSGTSFAAPVLAGQIADEVLTRYAEGDVSVSPEAAVKRCWSAVAAATAKDPQPLVQP